MSAVNWAQRALLRSLSYIAGHDPDKVEESNRLEKSGVVFLALTLFWAFFFAWALYYAYLSLVVSESAAIAVGAFVAFGVAFLLDRQIIASDWSPGGVLHRSKRHDVDYWVRLALRVVIAIVLSYMTALGAVCWIYKSEITQWLERDRAQRNTPLITEYNEKITLTTKHLSDTRLVPLQKDLVTLNEERTTTLLKTAAASRAAETFEGNAAKARIEAGRELQGGLPGYFAGEGGKFKEARRQQLEADRAALRADKSAQSAKERIADIDKRLDLKQQEVAKLNQEMIDREKAILVDRDNDPRWIKSATDALSLQRGLEGLKRDAVNGEIVTHNASLLKIVIIILELIPLLVKTVFGVGSILVVKYTARVKREAAQEAAEFAVSRDAAQGRRRPDLHVAGGTEYELQREHQANNARS